MQRIFNDFCVCIFTVRKKENENETFVMKKFTVKKIN